MGKKKEIIDSVNIERFKNTIGNKLWRLQNLYKIRDKNRQLNNITFNTIQKKIIEDIYNRPEGQGIRHLTIKARQVGISTFWVLWWLDDTITRRNTVTGILAHEWPNVQMLMEIARIAYENIPDDFKPPLGDDNKTCLTFPTLNSKFFAEISIRSTVVHNLHISEWCFCDDREIETTLSAVPENGNVSGESTGNGINNSGFRVFMESQETGGKFKARFFPWFFDSSYKQENGPQIIRTNEETLFAENALKRYGVSITDSMLRWRREKIRDLKYIFKQEFPENPTDAFQTSGNRFFDYDKIIKLMGTVDGNQNDFGFNMYREPIPGHLYVAGADVANMGADYSTLKIIDATSDEEVLSYRGKIGIEQFIDILDENCSRYNNALLCVENNNHGHAVLYGLSEVKRYPNLYRERDSKNYGFTTDQKSRINILEMLREYIEGGFECDAENFYPRFKVRDKVLLSELMGFELIDGKYQAKPGMNDDTIFSTAQAVYLLNNYKVRGMYSGIDKIKVFGKRESVL